MNIYLQIFLSVCGVATLLGVGYAQFKKGDRGESGDIAKFYRERMDDYKLIAETTRKEYSEKYEELLKKFGILEGQFNTEKALRQQYESILKDKNPETEQFMKFMVATQKEVVDILKEIHTYAKAEHDRDFQVTSTITKQ